jgi:hypothetical protein
MPETRFRQSYRVSQYLTLGMNTAIETWFR